MGSLKKYTTKRTLPTLKNPDRFCEICGHPYIAKATLQKTCSIECRKILWQMNTNIFKARYPLKEKEYNETRETKNPNIWKQKSRKGRLIIIKKLGGKCCANCNVSNPNWLHVDYIPTMRGTGYRHPRHLKWVLDHLDEFRLLCANHHYELTITGKIEGTEITQ